MKKKLKNLGRAMALSSPQRAPPLAIHMDHEYHSNPEEFNPARWNVS
jgi:hypothetical protein